MKTHRIHRSILIATLVALVGFSGIATADAYGPGSGYGKRGSSANGDCPRFHDGYRNSRGQWGGVDLTDEQIAQLNHLRTDFHKATTDLRADLRQKELSLQAELAKKEPDAAKAQTLQAEISALRGDLDAKRLAHRMEVRKIAPDAGFGPAMGYGAGPHHGRGSRGWK
ncbi:MAG: periplasmic heavy metal sensor [Desulfobacterales bacterium]|nr:periplasmic heavy metal sensor [Desulfobacteraceae bacterium]MDY0311129.1 periplasmic heavy metal sensor [Desulfobacterales bacterium]